MLMTIQGQGDMNLVVRVHHKCAQAMPACTASSERFARRCQNLVMTFVALMKAGLRPGVGFLEPGLIFWKLHYTHVGLQPILIFRTFETLMDGHREIVRAAYEGNTIRPNAVSMLIANRLRQFDEVIPRLKKGFVFEKKLFSLSKK